MTEGRISPPEIDDTEQRRVAAELWRKFAGEVGEEVQRLVALANWAEQCARLAERGEIGSPPR